MLILKVWKKIKRELSGLKFSEIFISKKPNERSLIQEIEKLISGDASGRVSR